MTTSPMTISAYLAKVKSAPETLEFGELMALIETHYNFTPTEFHNGDTVNQADQNQGSCKLFSFAELNGLSQAQTLACFGAFYRDDVLKHPDATDHQNIRNFIIHGWDGITFKGTALVEID